MKHGVGTQLNAFSIKKHVLPVEIFHSFPPSPEKALQKKDLLMQ